MAVVQLIISLIGAIKNEIIEITDIGAKLTLTYNADGTLSELRQTGTSERN